MCSTFWHQNLATFLSNMAERGHLLFGTHKLFCTLHMGLGYGKSLWFIIMMIIMTDQQISSQSAVHISMLYLHRRRTNLIPI